MNDESYRLKRKIALPHEALSNSLLLMTRLRRAASLARRAQRFVVLARRLEGQMGEIDGSSNAGGTENGLRSSVGPGEGERGTERRERAMAEAALTLAEIGELPKLNTVSFPSSLFAPTRFSQRRS